MLQEVLNTPRISETYESRTKQIANDGVNPSVIIFSLLVRYVSSLF